MKSKQYMAIEAVMRRAKAFKMSNLDLEAELERKRVQNAKGYKLPRAVQLILKPQKLTVANTTCYKLGTGSTCVLYFHGGSYVDPPLIAHWRFLQQLTREADVTVYLPIYGRAPQHHCSRTVMHMRKVYCELLAQYSSEHIVVMGDSAGGGLALAVCENLAEKKLPQPNKAILLSPWLDVDMTGEYEKCKISDPILIFDELKFFGACYRGQLPVGHYMASPLFGLSANLAPLHVFVGESELFYPDCAKLEQLAKDVGAELNLYSYKDMPHVFLMYPIPEAKTARAKVVDILNDGKELTHEKP